MQASVFDISGPVLLTPVRHRDARGFFSETYNERDLRSFLGDVRFVQDNHLMSLSAGTIRALHFQISPKAQGKLIRTTRGSVFDVAVDLRVGSPSYGRHVSAVLSADNWSQLWIPAGFAHGLCTLEPGTEIIYKTTDFYSPEHERGLLWNDPALAIAWPAVAATPTVLDKDKALPLLADLPAYFPG
jgi:dTDP-4-dehydrorhamnose 3,5-epimerase